MYKKLFVFLNQMIISVKCYYKQRQLILLQSATVITKCDDYYEVRQNNVKVSEICNH